MVRGRDDAGKCLGFREKMQPDDWPRFLTMSQLGAALVGQKRYSEAEPLLIPGYDGLKAREAKIPPPQKKYLATAAAEIVPFYEAWSKPGKAAEWPNGWRTSNPRDLFPLRADRLRSTVQWYHTHSE